MRLVLILITSFWIMPLWAGQMVGEDPLEERIRAIATQLRCPVCQSENILDSHSGTAREMLDLVREQAAAGHSDADILGFFQTRYGNYVLLSPPSSGSGAVIWTIPVLLMLGGLVLGALLIIRLRQPQTVSPDGARLTEARLEELEP